MHFYHLHAAGKENLVERVNRHDAVGKADETGHVTETLGVLRHDRDQRLSRKEPKEVERSLREESDHHVIK